LQTLLTSNLLHQNRLREGDWGAAASFIHSHHTDLQTVAGGLVLYNVAAGLLQFLIDCFPVLSWKEKNEECRICSRWNKPDEYEYWTSFNKPVLRGNKFFS